MKKWKVMLVDDDENDRLTFQRLLKSEGIDVELIMARDGREALDQLISDRFLQFQDKPDLILLDLNMGILDGFETLKILKTSESTRSIPVVVLTTSSNKRDIEASYALGANSYIVKPTSLDDFSKIIRGLKSYWADLVITPDRVA